MRALVIEDGAARLDKASRMARAGDGEVIVRVARVACSRQDAEPRTRGGRVVPGSDFVGVVEPGPAAGRLAGRRVVCSAVVSCAKCDMCVGGLATHCRSRALIGENDRHGALADFVAVPARNCVEVPPRVDDDHAVFASAVASALNASRQITIEGKPFITVLGDDYQALLAAQVMAKLNASVRLLGRFSEKLSLCEKWGIKHRHVDDVGRRADQDVVVDCTGEPEGLALAMGLIRPRGKIVLRLGHSADSQRANGPLDLTPLVAKELELIGSSGGSVREGLRLIERGEVDVVSLISRRMSLADGPAILQAAARPESVRVLVSIA